MNIKKLTGITSVLLASLSGLQAATTLAAWNFDNLPTGANSAPAASSGLGSALTLGFGASSSPTVISQPGSSSGAPNTWSVGSTGGSSVAWNYTAAIGTQGAQFAVNTLGYYQLQLSFDLYAKPGSEAALLVQYSQDGIFWQNASITSAGTAGILATNTTAQTPGNTNGLALGTYLLLTNSAAAGWNNGVTVNLTGVPGVANAPAFAVRIVNAATGTNCVDLTGALYNSASQGDWTLDNVSVQGISFDTVVDWSFDNQAAAKHINSPIPAISNSVNAAVANCIGFGTPINELISSTFSPNYSTNDADITANGSPYSSTGAAGQNVWRLRGQPGNGWLSTMPIGSQGAQFNVSTVNYSNVIMTFDLYLTTQGEARMCVLYATDGVNFTNVASLACSSHPTLIQTNTPDYNSESGVYSANTVNGAFLDDTIGSLFFNYMSVDLTGNTNVNNNPNFAFQIVNAATGLDCVNFLRQSYNNNSGNCRLDNVAVNGQFSGQTAPVITNTLAATVDFPFTNTFSESAAANDIGWHTKISAIYVNGLLLPKAAYAVTSSNLVYTPSAAAALTNAGFDYITIFATNYTSTKVVQFVGTGAAKKLGWNQPAGPSASGGTLTVNPAFTVTDQYGNPTTNPFINMVVTATVSNSTAWTLGGSTNQAMVGGSCTFTDLTATITGSTAITNAAILFTVTGYTNAANHSTTTNIYSSSFVIGAPPKQFTQGNLAVIQVDTTAANSTFSLVEIQPSAAGQTIPVNINPITATGPNALRMTTASGAGHLALSDDGTFLVFGAFDDNSSATPDETFNLNRAVGTMNYTNQFAKTGQFVSTSLGGSAVRAACSPDNYDFLIDDKGGLYVFNTASGAAINAYEQNNYCVRSFGGSAWSLTQKVVAGLPSPAVFQFNSGLVGQLDYADENGDDGSYNTTSATPPPDGFVVDFYLISTNGSQDPESFAILYTFDQISSSQGIINKWLRNDADDSWSSLGSWTNADSGSTLFATTNGNNGVYLFYANGTASGNSIVRVTDASVMGQINIITTNTIYTAPTNATAVGITFVPVPVAGTPTLIPPPILTAQTGAAITSGQFSITNTPDDPTWRSNITAITVNGTLLPAAAYSTNVSGMIVFYTARSPLLQTLGVKKIVISAAGYSTNSIAQTVVSGPPAQLAITTQPAAPLGAGGALTQQPVVEAWDAMGNLVSSANITAAAVQNTWTLGGSVTLPTSAGIAAYAGLTAFSTNAVAGATISFTSGTVVTNSSAFNIPAPIRSQLGGGKVSNGKFLFSFTNITGLSFSVLGTNNLAAPIAAWPLVGAATESPAGSGHYQFTNSATTNTPLFYILRQP